MSNKMSPPSQRAKQPHRRVQQMAASASAVLLSSQALAGSSPFARIVDPGKQAAQAAVQQAQQGASAAAASQRTLAAFTAAMAVRQSLEAAQQAARRAAAAAQSGVPNGLGAGALDGDVRLWTNAKAPVQTAEANGRTQVAIQQTQPQAILNWTTFNVGQLTDLKFQQQAVSWVALNRVTDPAANPTQILGTISAPGKVLIMNANGVIFGGASQVNVGSLVAGAANITDSQLLSNGIYSVQSNGYLPSFTGAAGNVTVEQGAQIATPVPTVVTQGGGYVLLLGQQVTNAGTITTPQGQAELAAGDNFLLRQGQGTQSNATSSTRGNEIAVQLNVPGSSTTGGSGYVANRGVIEADTGDVTLAGETVVNSGALLSTTSVNVRGTIHLLSPFTDPLSSVTLAPGSVLAIMPDTSGATAVDGQRAALIAASGPDLYDAQFFNDLSQLADLADASRVEIVSGGNVELRGGSATLANGGQVAVSAARRVQADTGALIDVSGLQNVALPMSANVVQVNIQGNELRDDPNNRDTSALNSTNVWVDTRDLTLVPAGTGGYASDRYYTAGGLLEVSGYLGTTGHSIQEWQAIGGTITLSAGEVVAQPGSTFNIAGGSVQYQAGFVPQSYVIATTGQIYNVNTAPADLTYSGIYSGFMVAHPHWGPQLTQSYASPLVIPSQTFEPGYTVGRDAGTLILSAPTAVFEGSIEAGVVQGLGQTTAHPAGVTDPYTLPQDVAPLPGTLALGQYGSLGLAGAFNTAVVFGAGAPLAASLEVGTALPGARTGTAWLDAAQLSAAGLGGLNIVTAGEITISAPLTLAPGAQLTFIAPDIDVGANLTARSGQVSLGNLLSVATLSTSGPPNVVSSVLADANGGSNVTIGGNSTIDLRGLWTNAGLNAQMAPGLAFINGGSLSAGTTGAVTLAAGSTIDVSSGGSITLAGSAVGGRGGSVSLLADNYPQAQLLTAYEAADITQPLIVDGTIRGYGFGGGGTLTLAAGQPVVIGASASLSGKTLTAGTPAATSVILSQPLTIPAGSTMPLDYQVSTDDVPADTPLTMSFNTNSALYKTAASWTLTAADASLDVVGPQGKIYFFDGSSTPDASNTIPAGTQVEFTFGIPQGAVIPSAVFPTGVQLLNPFVSATYLAGQTVTVPVVLPVGTALPAGTVLSQNAAIRPALVLSPSLLQTGFSSYSISSNSGMLVNTPVTAAVPVYTFGPRASAVPTGSDPALAGTLTTLPPWTLDPTTDQVQQRPGASLSLTSLHDFVLSPGASLSVDPGQAVSIFANGQTTLDGNITAHGGAILVASLQDPFNDGRYLQGFGDLSLTRSVFIGAGTKLDASGLAVTATDLRGLTFGEVQDGGSITIGTTGRILTDPGAGSGFGQNNQPISSDAFIILRPTAMLDASGASAVLDVTAGAARLAQPVDVAGNGGTIGLYSSTGMYLDGALVAAAGGPGAAGGTLNVAMASHAYGQDSAPLSPPVARNITLVQDNPGSSLAADLQAGQADPNLQFGQAVLGVNQITAGGFDTVSIYSSNLIMFQGDVSLSVGKSLGFTGAILAAAPSTPDIAVRLAAPYVSFAGWNDDNSIVGAFEYYDGLNNRTSVLPGTATATGSRFTVSANLIDVSGDLQFGVHADQYDGTITGTVSVPQVLDVPGFNSVTLASSGDIRFGSGTLQADNITLQAAQIYPVSGASMTIKAGLQSIMGMDFEEQVVNPADTLTILGDGGAAAAVPASVFGNLALEAPNIVQNGVVRAPLGDIFFGESVFGTHDFSPLKTADGSLVSLSVTFGPKSLTSVSAAGLSIPFGGTSDGVTYTGAGEALSAALGETALGSSTTVPPGGVAVVADSVVGDKGAVIDLSGGGNLTGAGFISGRGGSIDVLTTPLVSANPANSPFSSAKDAVYAILPGYASGYAPIIASNGAGNPAIGEQVTLGAGVPGLPAGTYTLLPSSYALQPGAYRIELGGSATVAGAPVSLGNGSYLADATLGFAHTAINGVLPVRAVLSSGTGVRDNSQYDETSYSDFQIAQAQTNGTIRPQLPEDGKVLQLTLGVSPQTGLTTFDYAGTARFGGDGGGLAGALVVTALPTVNGFTQTIPQIDVTGPGATPIVGDVSLPASSINAFQAPVLMIGGGLQLGGNNTGNTVTTVLGFNGNPLEVINVLGGATLRAGAVFLNGVINVETGAAIDTRGLAATGVDSTAGYVFANGDDPSFAAAVLAVGNGDYNFLAPQGTATISISDGASLLTDGTIALVAPQGLTLGENVQFGARTMEVALQNLNIGTTASLAAAQTKGVVPAGWTLTQDTLDTLTRSGLQELVLTVAGSVNLFGQVGLDLKAANGAASTLELNAPALYGLGTAGDVATITADNFFWNGIRAGAASQTPPAVAAGGAGTGLGVLDIDAGKIVFGFADDAARSDGVPLNRVISGFSAVNLAASGQIDVNQDGTLTVGQSIGATGTPAGGSLTMTTPLLTAHNGATMAYTVGGPVQIAAPAGAAASTASIDTIGGTLTFNGTRISLDTAVAMPSGQLALNAAGDVSLGAGADIDLAGRALPFFDVTQYSWGGNLNLTSSSGNITQAAGSVIDVSAVGNVAGAITATADSGTVQLAGALKGAAGGGFTGGTITLAGQSLGDFGALNGKLDSGGFSGGRSFDVRAGDLTVGDVTAQSIAIAVDAGSLTVNGTLDASGAAPGSIRLSSSGDLTLAASSILDAHGKVLQTDSYGAAIDASNTAHVTLASAGGTVTLAPGATIDMAAADGVARGQLEIDAPRLGGTDGTGTGADSVAVQAAGPLNIRGASSIAVNAFRTYELAGGSTIDQALLDGYDTDSTAFIAAAYGNNTAGGVLTADLQSRLGGLLAYGDVFHLRPGVAITSSGDLVTSGDIDLSGYRYGPGANPAVRGSGEPGDLQIRAAGNLDINGSITDGFAPPPSSPDNLPAVTLFTNTTLTADFTAAGLVSLGQNVGLPASASLNFDLTFGGQVFLNGTATLPFAVTVSGRPQLLANEVLSASITLPNGVVIPAGTNTSDPVVLADLAALEGASGSALIVPPGSVIGQGMNAVFNGGISTTLTSWPAGLPLSYLTSGATFSLFNPLILSAGQTLPAGTFIPSGVQPSTTAPPQPIWAIAPLLPSGSQSWSMTLVGGADLSGSDARAVQPQASLNGSGNVVLNDPFQIVQYTGFAPMAGIGVIRTGTGSLSILAGGDYVQDTPYGVYTAGTAIPVDPTYNPARALAPDGTALGAQFSSYASTLTGAPYMYFTQGGGDVLLSAQGNILATQTTDLDTALPGAWLWREGGAALGQPAAWGINFGSYTSSTSSGETSLVLSAFSGVGTLGGGNVTIAAGGDIGDMAGRGITAAVGSTGRVMADGSLAQTGGGTLTVSSGGNIGTGGNEFANVRGNINVLTDNYGTTASSVFGYEGGDDANLHAVNPLAPYAATLLDGGYIVPGDGVVNLRARGNIAAGAIIDPGRAALEEGTQATADAASGEAVTWFTLWTNTTAVNFFGGGSVAPLNQNQIGGITTVGLPPIMSATAGGNIYVTPASFEGSLQMPSPSGALNLFATDSVLGMEFGELGTNSVPLSSLATPLRPGWELLNTGTEAVPSDYWGNADLNGDCANCVIQVAGTGYNQLYTGSFSGFGAPRWGGTGGQLYVLGPDTVGDGSPEPSGSSPLSHIYALTGDVSELTLGHISSGVISFVNEASENFIHAVKPVQILAGGDIVDLSAEILQNDPVTISMIAAQGGVLLPKVDVYGPGTLEVTAGGNILLGSAGFINSAGPLVTGDQRPGTNVVLQAGVGPGAPGVGSVDWNGFAALYLNPANQAAAAIPDTDPRNAGKVPQTYLDPLYAWLQQRFGYTGSESDALAFFEMLPADQQRVFLREVYYDELNASGLEFNDPASKRFKSYLRGRDAIAALFPDQGAYQGDVTLYSATGTLPNFTHGVLSGYVHTDFGGDIQLLAPGGGVTVGTEGLAPGAAAGLVTQGAGDIDIYSDDSVLLGLSRIMTTFGGNILVWSATGDINAGKGAKTTVVFTPPKRVYDDYGQVTLSSQTPSTGAGIATLAPIPQVPPGDVNLVAPLGTVDAGEAGIRVSGNLNIAALQVLNAANIQVQGTATGIPTAATVNVGALTSAGNASAAITKIAEQIANQAPPRPPVTPSIVTSTFLGFGEP